MFFSAAYMRQKSILCFNLHSGVPIHVGKTMYYTNYQNITNTIDCVDSPHYLTLFDTICCSFFNANNIVAFF